jgi:guanylate kinase
MKPVYKPLIIGSPSGGGKGTLITRLLKDFPHVFQKNASYTTRKIREGEVNGVDRFFVTVADFEKEIEHKNFVEFARFADNYYGTNRRYIQSIVDAGKICLIEVEIEGIKAIFNSDLQCNYLYMLPPSMEVLKKRLTGRGTETADVVEKRLKIAEGEINFAKNCKMFSRLMVNDDFEHFYLQVKQYLNELYPGIALK